MIKLIKGETEAEVLAYGATLRTLKIGGIDAVIGYDTEDEYKVGDCYYGATIGRVCNRTPEGIVNDGISEYALPLNEKHNCLHGGEQGFSKRQWTVAEQTGDSVTLTLYSPNGESGYRGNVNASVTYTLLKRGLHISLNAVTDAPCPICMTNHSYFNLNGVFESSDVLSHRVKINASRFSPLNEKQNPCGHFDVAGTPFDFRVPHTVGERINGSEAQLLIAGGYDHNFLLDGENAAEAAGSRLRMEAVTNLPCIQFYTGNFCPNGVPMKYGKYQRKRCGLCFEPQYEPGFATRGEHILHPGERFSAEIEYNFLTI